MIAINSALEVCLQYVSFDSKEPQSIAQAINSWRTLGALLTHSPDIRAKCQKPSKAALKEDITDTVVFVSSQQGFGNIDGEYWLGLENIYWLTNQGNYKLLVTLEDWSGRKVFAEYASFRVENEADFYKLRVGRYHGNAGDSLTWHNGKQFTTLDRDHDAYTGKMWQSSKQL